MSRQKKKGTAFESAVCEYLREHGFPEAERLASGGNRDRGDITGVGDVVIECKNTKELELAQAVDEAGDEAVEAEASFGVAVVKRRNRSVSEAYAVVPLRVMVDILRLRKM